MARTRQRPNVSLLAARRKRKPRISHADKLREISRYERVRDPTNVRAVARRYRALKHFPLYLLRKADKPTLAELKKRGFFVTDKGVFVDGPRDVRRKPIPNTRMEIMRDGVIKWRNGNRADYVIGFTRQDKKEFVRDPDAFTKKKLKELKEKFPTLKDAKSLQVRLQWGAYQGTKDFSPSYFTQRYFAPEKGRIDKLTGLHVVAHIPRHLTGMHVTAKGRKNGKRKKKARRRS